REIFGKVMSISDDMMWRYYELLTDLTPSEVSALREATARGERHPREVKAELGRLIVADFYSRAEAEEASGEFDRMFRERQAPSEIPLVERVAGRVRLGKLIASEGLAPSVTEAQRLISQGSVRVDNERVSDTKYDLTGEPGQEALIQVGKRKFLRIHFR
ncbi:MAG TPA: S4 domain-containing protein, partial [Blastocatellia bacterium]|nr:S4 domain-containing protein [Blastocatellia bacterium]